MKKPSELNAIRRYLGDLGFEMVKIEPHVHSNGTQSKYSSNLTFVGKWWNGSPATIFLGGVTGFSPSGKSMGKVDNADCYWSCEFDDKGNCWRVEFEFNGLSYDAYYVATARLDTLFKVVPKS